MIRKFNVDDITSNEVVLPELRLFSAIIFQAFHDGCEVRTPGILSHRRQQLGNQLQQLRHMNESVRAGS